jgi:uncharacterized protein YybS (DUF2232 family)
MEMWIALFLQLAVAGFFFILAGLSTAWALLKGLRPRSAVLTGAATMALLAAALFFLGHGERGQGPGSLRGYFSQDTFEQEWKVDSQAAVKMGVSQERMDGFKEDYRKYFYNLFPAWVAVWCLTWGLLAYYAASFALARLTLRVPKAKAFREWVVPEPLIFGLIASGLAKVLAPKGEWLDLLGSNLLLFFAALYLLGGLSIVSFFFHKWRLPATLRVLSYVLLVQLTLDPLCILGVLDVWFDFRKLKSAPPEPAS